MDRWEDRKSGKVLRNTPPMPICGKGCNPSIRGIVARKDTFPPVFLLERGNIPHQLAGKIMKIHPAAQVKRLEDLPNIGKSIAADLRGLGILTPEELSKRAPLDVFNELAGPMNQRHDPCVLHTLLAVEHFQKTAESVPWWKFTQEGKRLLREGP